MKKLKVYEKVDFRLIDATLGSNVCDKIMSKSDVTQGAISKGDGEFDGDADEAPIFRPGIWDED